MSGSFLSRHLPKQTVAYLRLPNPWASLGDVVGRPADAAYASVAWREQLETLKAAVRIAANNDQWPPGLADALVYVDGPVELALVTPNASMGAESKVWVTAALAIDDPETVAAWLTTLQIAAPAATVVPADADLSTSVDSADESPADSGDTSDAATTQTETSGTEAEDPDKSAAEPVAVQFDNNGYGQMQLGLVQPALLKFDTTQRRLHVLINLAEGSPPNSLLGSLTQESSHPARSQIESADHSNRGLAAWVSAELLRPFVDAQEPLQILLKAGTGWTFAVGTVDGRGQISLNLAGVDPALLARLPKGFRELPVTSAPDPRWAVMFALPSAAEWASARAWLAPPPVAVDNVIDSVDAATDDESTTTAESIAATQSAPPTLSWVDQFDSSLRDITGISATTLFSRVGPEFAIWRDSAGTFATLRVKDPDGLDSLLAHLSNRLAGQLKMRRWNGMDIHEFSFVLERALNPVDRVVSTTVATGEIDESAIAPLPPAAANAEELAVSDAEKAAQEPIAEPSFWTRGLTRLRGRAYWVKEDDHLVIAELPQVLADRQFSPDKTTLQAWLTDVQSRDPSGTIAVATAVSDSLQRDSYHGMIQVLQALGDVLQVEIDPYAFPNADELRLPEQGSISARLGVAGNRLSLSLSYEDSPAELLQGPGGLATVASAGILSAIALPAYHDYRARHALRRALRSTQSLREAIMQHQQQRRRWPRNLGQLGLTEEAVSVFNSGNAQWQIKNGELTVTFPDSADLAPGLASQTLAIALTDDGSWQCLTESSSVAERLMAAVCADFHQPAEEAVLP